MEKPSRVLRFDVLDSTQEWARAHLDGLPGFALVAAARQTAGHGRRGRAWLSGEGGLSFTLVFVPRAPAAARPQYAQVAAIAMARALRARRGVPVSLKWPNDLLAAGAKLSGILLDSAGAGPGTRMLLGVGMNVLSAPAVADRPVCALADFLETPPSPDEVLEEMVDAIAEGFDRFEREGMAPFAADFRTFDALVGTRRRLLTGREELEGVVLGVTDDGALRFLPDGGAERVVWSGEILI